MNILLLFIKNPERGKVKTRIAATAGEERAFQIYSELLRHTRALAQQVHARRWLFYSDFVDTNDDWQASDFEKMVQQGTDLGERMQGAFRQAFAAGATKVVIIGSDCAALTAELVEAAFQQLDHTSFVIGPALDGGYYLLGMNQFYPEVFDNIAWSTEKVLAATLERIQSLGHNYSLLPVLSDIDYESDWEQHGWTIP